MGDTATDKWASSVYVFRRSKPFTVRSFEMAGTPRDFRSRPWAIRHIRHHSDAHIHLYGHSTHSNSNVRYPRDPLSSLCAPYPMVTPSFNGSREEKRRARKTRKERLDYLHTTRKTRAAERDVLTLPLVILKFLVPPNGSQATLHSSAASQKGG